MPIYFSAILLALFLATPSHAQRFVRGRAYPIEEKDFYEEMQQRVAAVDMSKYFDKDKWKKRLQTYQPRDLATLPRAEKTQTRWVDPTQELPFDIPGPDGTVQYPKGYRYNVLNYLHLTYQYLIFDASDPQQLAWATSLAGASDPMVRILLSGGNYWDTMKALNRRVYFLQKAFAKRLGISVAPSLVQQDGNRLKVQEFAMENFEISNKTLPIKPAETPQ